MSENPSLPCLDELVATQANLKAIIDELDLLSNDFEESNEQLTRIRAINNSVKGLHSVVRTYHHRRSPQRRAV